MSREVITETNVQEAKLRKASAGGLAAGGAEKVPTADEYSDRLIKYIPSEVVSVYLFADGLLRSSENQIPKNTLQWTVFAILLVMTPFYLRRIQKVKKYQQLAIATISFAAWVFTLGGPFTQFTWYHSVYGLLLLPIYTFGIAIFKAEK